MERINEKQKENIKIFIASGWYPIVNMSHEYVDDDDDINQVMEQQINDNSGEIEKRILQI